MIHATIRNVQLADVADVMALVREVLSEFGLCFGEGATTDDQLRELPASYVDHGGAFWVANQEDGRILATCGVFPVFSDVFELRKMYLRPETRGLGIGRRLLDHAFAFCRERGARRMVLDTTERMTRAIAFYEANGFTRDDTQIRGERCSRGYVREI